MRSAYLSCMDAEITKRKNEVKAYNNRLIDAHHKLPFCRRWFLEEALKQQIIANWGEFQKWMNERNESMSS